MAEEIKKPVEGSQAPAAEQKPTEEKKPEQQAKGPSGLDGLNEEGLREFYKKSPGMFKKIIEEVQAEKKPEEKPKSNEPPASAAPKDRLVKYVDKDIKLPVEVTDEAVQPYLDHWKEMGFSPEQVQREVDFMVARATKAKETQQPKQKTPAEINAEEDARNVATLKADPEFGGKDFEANMEIARRGAKKYFTPETLSRMVTSDPVLVKQAWKFGQMDKEDSTPSRGSPRTGNENEQPKREDPRSDGALKKRFPNSPQMFD